MMSMLQVLAQRSKRVGAEGFEGEFAGWFWSKTKSLSERTQALMSLNNTMMALPKKSGKEQVEELAAPCCLHVLGWQWLDGWGFISTFFHFLYIKKTVLYKRLISVHVYKEPTESQSAHLARIQPHHSMHFFKSTITNHLKKNHFNNI